MTLTVRSLRIGPLSCVLAFQLVWSCIWPSQGSGIAHVLDLVVSTPGLLWLLDLDVRRKIDRRRSNQIRVHVTV